MAINLELIAETIVGLKTYEVKIDDHKMNRYMRFSQSHNMPSVNIWAFVCAIILFMLNMVGKQLKNDYMEEYAVRKVVESFYNMRKIETEEPEGIQFGIST